MTDDDLRDDRYFTGLLERWSQRNGDLKMPRLILMMQHLWTETPYVSVLSLLWLIVRGCSTVRQVGKLLLRTAVPQETKVCLPRFVPKCTIMSLYFL